MSDDRLTIDPSLERSELGLARERFVFRLGHDQRTVELVLRDGFVTDEFIALTRQPDRSEAEEERLTAMKEEMAELVMAAAADSVYDAAVI